MYIPASVLRPFLPLVGLQAFKTRIRRILCDSIAFSFHCRTLPSSKPLCGVCVVFHDIQMGHHFLLLCPAILQVYCYGNGICACPHLWTHLWTHLWNHLWPICMNWFWILFIWSNLVFKYVCSTFGRVIHTMENNIKWSSLANSLVYCYSNKTTCIIYRGNTLQRIRCLLHAGNEIVRPQFISSTSNLRCSSCIWQWMNTIWCHFAKRVDCKYKPV